ncbi:MAG: FHA domain-containing protein, partial [Nocardioides sp.]
MSLDVRYAPGSGVLLGAGSRWLLLAVDAASDERFVDRLWDLVTAPRAPAELLLDVVEEHEGPEVSLVYVDLTPGSESTVIRGTGRLANSLGVRSLRLAEPSAAVSRRLVSGVVAAAAAELRPMTRAAPVVVVPEPAPETAAVDGVIDGIPDDILSSVAPPRAENPPVETAEPRPDDSIRRLAERVGHTVRRGPDAPASPHADAPDTDHDGHTTYRPDLGMSAPAARPAPEDPLDHLQQPTHETVLAVYCSAGHVTAAYTPTCRVCEEPLPQQEPQRMPRPRLGVLHLPDGQRIPLDRNVVFGRQPSAPPESGPWPHLVRLSGDATYVSRTHLQIELDGWLVLATDLGSRGGTTLRIAGRAPERIRANERYVWEPGQVLDLAD